jgi:hypothetical protein
VSTSRTLAGAFTAAQANDLAQGTLGYAAVTANQGSITTLVDLTGLTVTVTVVAGRRLKITGHCTLASTVATDTVELVLVKDGATAQLARFGNAQANILQFIDIFFVDTPTAGSHTYKLQADRQAGTGTLTMNAGGTFPAFILVEDIGT